MFRQSVALCTFFVLLTHYSTVALPHDRVVGGDTAAVGQFPYQVSLQEHGGSHICGGSILNERYILTAAHCVVVGNGIAPYPVQYFQVRVGSILWNAGGKLLKLKRIIVNKTFGNFLNDVALLELETPLIWNDYIKPIDLADTEVPSGADVTISGWGLMYPGEPSPYRLQWTTLQAISTDECDERIGWNYDSLICLDHEVAKGTCDGDAGGPAVYQGKLVGIASFHIGGCASANPDSYTKVLYYNEWILQNMTE